MHGQKAWHERNVVHGRKVMHELKATHELKVKHELRAMSGPTVGTGFGIDVWTVDWQGIPPRNVHIVRHIGLKEVRIRNFCGRQRGQIHLRIGIHTD